MPERGAVRPVVEPNLTATAESEADLDLEVAAQRCHGIRAMAEHRLENRVVREGPRQQIGGTRALAD
jgi:hypothetical protein